MVVTVCTPIFCTFTVSGCGLDCRCLPTPQYIFFVLCSSLGNKVVLIFKKTKCSHVLPCLLKQLYQGETTHNKQWQGYASFPPLPSVKTLSKETTQIKQGWKKCASSLPSLLQWLSHGTPDTVNKAKKSASFLPCLLLSQKTMQSEGRRSMLVSHPLF